jgi:hypothetical protein
MLGREFGNTNHEQNPRLAVGAGFYGQSATGRRPRIVDAYSLTWDDIGSSHNCPERLRRKVKAKC